MDDPDMNSNMITNLFMASALAVCVVSPVSAADGPFCVGEFEALQVEIDNAIFLNERDRTGVSNKATQAEAKANLHKCSDALDKLDEIDAKVTSLSDPQQTRKVKLSEEDATNIMLKTGAAVECIDATISSCITK